MTYQPQSKLGRVSCHQSIQPSTHVGALVPTHRIQDSDLQELSKPNKIMTKNYYLFVQIFFFASVGSYLEILLFDQSSWLKILTVIYPYYTLFTGNRYST